MHTCCRAVDSEHMDSSALGLPFPTLHTDHHLELDTYASPNYRAQTSTLP